MKRKWILSNLETDAIIYKSVKKSESITVNSKSENVFENKEKIDLRTYLLNEMSLDVTQFIFKKNTFKFFRKEDLTFEGIFSLENETIFLNFKHNGVDNSKEMKLISVTESELVLESKSHNKPFILIFKR